jgi:hypothetical protein
MLSKRIWVDEGSKQGLGVKTSYGCRMWASYTKSIVYFTVEPMTTSSRCFGRCVELLRVRLPCRHPSLFLEFRRLCEPGKLNLQRLQPLLFNHFCDIRTADTLSPLQLHRWRDYMQSSSVPKQDARIKHLNLAPASSPFSCGSPSSRNASRGSASSSSSCASHTSPRNTTSSCSSARCRGRCSASGTASCWCPR